MEILTYTLMIISGVVIASMYFMPRIHALNFEIKAANTRLSRMKENVDFMNSNRVNLRDEIGG